MKLSDINPHIRYASTHYYHFSKSFDSICYDCRLFFIKEGHGYFSANDAEHPFSENTVLFFPSGTKYHIYPDKNSRFVAIVVNFDLVNTFSHLSKSLGTASVQNYDPRQLITYEMPQEFSAVFSRTIPSAANYLEKCCEEFLLQNPLYRETASALLKLCLLELVKNRGYTEESSKILPVLDYIHKHYPDPTLTNETIAALFHYHPYYLSQLIRQHTGQSLHRYLISYRIKMAKKMLITTDEAISTIAWKSGFPSPAYFIKQFKAQVGVTPHVYRKTHIDFLF